MIIESIILSKNNEVIFQGKTEVDSGDIIELSEHRINIPKEKGEEWAAGAISFFATERI